MLFRTIRAKLVAWYTMVLAALLVAFSVMLYFFLSRALYDSVDKKIETIAEITADSTTRNIEESEGWNDFLEEFFGFKPTAKYIQILDKSGNIDYDADGSLPKKLPITAETIRRATNGEIVYETLEGLDEYPIRVVSYPVLKNGNLVNLVQVGTSLEYVEETLNRLLFIILLTVPTMILFSSVGGYLLAKAALRPVAEITTAARKIGAENLSQRIKIRNQKDELGMLAETFNEMIERLGKSFSQVKQFSADASHELRTPLTILKGETEWALRSARGEKEYRATLTSNLEEIDHMSKIIEDLLILSRADIGEEYVVLEPIKIAPILQEVYDTGKILADMKSKKLSLALGDLDGVTIMGDKHRLRQLFLNLIDNGIKYTRKNGSVDLSAQMTAKNLKITVSDDGIGISGRDQKRIFDRFYRVDKNRSRKEGGTGLGLSICKVIAEAHHGKISVKSRPGKGSTFIIDLPTAGSDD
jgi:heavy metal sensor kinase